MCPFYQFYSCIYIKKFCPPSIKQNKFPLLRIVPRIQSALHEMQRLSLLPQRSGINLGPVFRFQSTYVRKVLTVGHVHSSPTYLTHLISLARGARDPITKVRTRNDKMTISKRRFPCNKHTKHKQRHSVNTKTHSRTRHHYKTKKMALASTMVKVTAAAILLLQFAGKQASSFSRK